MSLQVLEQQALSFHLLTNHDTSSCLSCLKSIWQAVHLMIFTNLVPTNPFNAASGRPSFCVKILRRNTRCRKVVFVSVNTGSTCEFWGFLQSCTLLRSLAPRHCTIDCRRFGTTYYSRNTDNPLPYDLLALYTRRADILGGTYRNHRAQKR